MLAGSSLKELAVKPFLYLVTALRCFIFPLIFMLVLWLLPLDRTMCMGVTILAACPSGSLAAVLAKQCNMEEKLASQAVAHSTLFIVISIPLMLGLAQKLYFG
jgi:predicted permease